MLGRLLSTVSAAVSFSASLNQPPRAEAAARGSMRTCAGLVLAGVLSLHFQASAQPALVSSYFESSLSFDACMQRGESVMRAYGAPAVQRLNTAIGAKYGDYTINIFCITAKSLVMVVVAGPDSQTGVNHLNSIAQKMNAR